MTPEMYACYRSVDVNGDSYSDMEKTSFRGDAIRYVTHIKRKKR